MLAEGRRFSGGRGRVSVEGLEMYAGDLGICRPDFQKAWRSVPGTNSWRGYLRMVMRGSGRNGTEKPQGRFESSE